MLLDLKAITTHFLRLLESNETDINLYVPIIERSL